MTSNNRFESTRKFQDEENATGSEIDYTPLIAVGGFLVLGGFGARAFIRQAKKLGEESAKDLKKTQEAFEKSRQNFKNPFTVKSDSTSASGTNEGGAATNNKSKIEFKFKTINLKNKVDNEQIKKDLEKMLKEAAKQKITKKTGQKALGNLFEDIIEKGIKAMEGENKKPPSAPGKDGQKGAAPEKDTFDKVLDKIFGEENLGQKVDNNKKDQKAGSGSNSEPKTAPDPRAKIASSKNSSSKDGKTSGINITAIFDSFLGDGHLAGGFEEASKHGMSSTEARRILQFEINGPPPSKDQIMDNFRVLSRTNHPDLGGSAYLASKVNEAKDVLLKESKKRNRRR